jgi:diguanylate cyclase (GGDEF)-like protein/PAS domain S-box-containing protein
MTTNPSYRILLVEDDEEDVLILRDLLSDLTDLQVTLDWVTSLDDAVDPLHRREHDLYMVDYYLGAGTALDFIALCAAEGVRRPVLILTGRDDLEADRSALRSGAADYLPKTGLTAAMLGRSIRHAVERHRLMAALHDGATRYRILFDDHPLAMMLVSPEGGEIMLANAAAARLLGHTRERLAQLHLDDLAAAEWKAHLLVDIRRAVGAQPPMPLRGLLQRTDGASIHIELSPHAFEFGEALAWLVMLDDLTELAAAQNQAQRLESTLSGVLHDTLDALLVVEDGRIEYLNPAAQSLLEGHVRRGGPLPVALAAPLDHAAQRRLTHADGRLRDLEVRTSATEWEGRPSQLVTVRDVTEELQSRRDALLGQRAMAQSANGIVIVDALLPDMPIVYVNPAFERITGYNRDEVLGRNCRFLQRRDGGQSERHLIRDAIDRGDDVQVVLRNYRKDGTLFWNELSVSPVRDGSGRITHFVGIQNDITERKRQEAELAHRATHDSLTDLPSRETLQDRLQQALTLSRRSGRTVGVLFIDLDQFKTINDSLGHDQGDQLLREVAKRLAEALRAGDSVCRLGSDEFVAVLPDLHRPDDVVAVAEHLLADLSRPYLMDGQAVHLTCSIGVALATPETLSPSQLIGHADLAMFAAKKAGRNTYHVYTDDLDLRSRERLELRNRLQVAIQNEEFSLHYQPQFELGSGRLCGIEALLRWNHPELGQVAPNRFIPVAEETGQIVPIGEWVLREACRQAADWVQRGLIDCPMAVNISGLQFVRPQFEQTVKAALTASGLEPARLELELTESVMMDQSGRAMEVLHRLRALGVRMSIDDFGTGFSSLSYLKRMPVDKIKIDRAFVTDITTNAEDASITLSIIAMAHHLGLKVIAEGVETEAQLNYLRRHLCDEGQGYLFSRPLEPAAFETYLCAPRVHGSRPQEDGTGQRPTLLLVDDEPNILRALVRVLRNDGYRILTADGARSAFELLASHDVQVVLSDQRMPEICGTDFLSEVKSLYPQTVRMVLSGYTDLATITEAINRGAIYRFLTKPWEDESLRAHIREAFSHQRMLGSGSGGAE